MFRVAISTALVTGLPIPPGVLGGIAFGKHIFLARATAIKGEAWYKATLFGTTVAAKQSTRCIRTIAHVWVFFYLVSALFVAWAFTIRDQGHVLRYTVVFRAAILGMIVFAITRLVGAGTKLFEAMQFCFLQLF